MTPRRNSSTELLLAIAAGCALFSVGITFRSETFDSLASLRQRSALHPNDPAIQQQLVEKLVNAKRTPEAVSLLRQRLAESPGDVDLQQSLVDLLVTSDRLNEAIDVLREKLALHPADAAGHEALANMLDQAGRFDEAESLYKQIIAKSAPRPSTSYGLAQVYTHKGDILSAQRTLEDSLKKHPDDAASNELLADLAIKSLGEIAYPIAQKYYERSLAAEPARSGAALSLSKIYATQKHYEEAAKVLVKPAAQDRKNAALHLQYADILAVLQRYDEAEIQFNQGTAADPDNADALARWGTMLVNCGKPVAAVSVLRHALEVYQTALGKSPQLKPKGAEYHMQLARALRDKSLTGYGGSVAAAMDEFNAALDCDPMYVPVYLELAQTYQDAHDVKTAENFLRTALRVAPSDPLAKARLARLLFTTSSGTNDEVIELLAQAVSETHSQDISLLAAFASALGRSQKYDMAIEQMDLAIAGAPAAGYQPWQIELLAELRQQFRMAIAPPAVGHASFNSVDGRVERDAADEQWPDPAQPSVLSLTRFPMDISRPPAPGNALDPSLYMGLSKDKPKGSFGGLPVLDIIK